MTPRTICRYILCRVSILQKYDYDLLSFFKFFLPLFSFNSTEVRLWPSSKATAMASQAAMFQFYRSTIMTLLEDGLEPRLQCFNSTEVRLWQKKTKIKLLDLTFGFQFYRSTIMTRQTRRNRNNDSGVSILQKYDYDSFPNTDIRKRKIVSILQKYDYDETRTLHQYYQ